jgi:hypothetical protein
MLQDVTKERHSVQATAQKEHSDRRHDGIECGIPLFEDQSHFLMKYAPDIRGDGVIGVLSEMAMLQQPEQNELISWCCN